MLESLVGLAVGAVLGLAMAWGAAQALKSQRFSTTQNMVVFTMRQALANATSVSAGTTSTPLSVTIDTSNLSLSANRTCSAPTTIAATVATYAANISYQKPCGLATVNDATNRSVVGGDGVIEF